MKNIKLPLYHVGYLKTDVEVNGVTLHKDDRFLVVASIMDENLCTSKFVILDQETFISCTVDFDQIDLVTIGNNIPLVSEDRQQNNILYPVLTQVPSYRF